MHALAHTRPGVFATLFLLTVALAGCASDPAKRPGERSRREGPMPTLTGRQDFFDGNLIAEVTIGPMAGLTRSGTNPREAGQEGRPGRHGGGGGFGGGMGDGPGMPPPAGAGPGEMNERPRGSGARRDAPAGPPVMIHLKFTNHDTEPVDLRIEDFLSPLGNFVIHPEKLTLAPGASAEVEPMASGLAQQAVGGEITLALRLGPRTETKAVPLQVEAAPGPGSGKSGQSL